MSVQDKVDPIVADFISYIKNERALSSNTLLAYRKDIEEFHEFIRRRGELSSSPPQWPPKKDDIEAYAHHLHSSSLQLSSQSRKLVALKVFLRFLFREEYIEHNIAKVIETPKQWQKVPQTLDYNEVELLIRAPSLECPEGIRDRAMFELLYGTGIRVSELCSLTIYDVSDSTIRVQGKGGKERIVPIGKEVISSIDRYLNEVRCLYESEKNLYLFVSSRGKRMHRESVWKIVVRYAKKLGIEKRVSPHVFRHTYASHLLDGGADVRVIQDLLGHAHISSTDRYTQVSCAQIQEAFYTFHPRWSGSESVKK